MLQRILIKYFVLVVAIFCLFEGIHNLVFSGNKALDIVIANSIASWGILVLGVLCLIGFIAFVFKDKSLF
ncbi:hypothetical protein [Tengunoibacter tsumagoiensis]|uniref:Uncharacterized protein n=1 Tax=Tengunoibacter tsumagoiensis TaxID=2014871 RepID=A0A401ZZ76_9CHLR|nr:hypothetical protein [Tengunoibacter tsumagoiensis]GCE12159.1 hypothetical protein KTT_20180 [Tengunoibacter tsumagoiensis]